MRIINGEISRVRQDGDYSTIIVLGSSLSLAKAATQYPKRQVVDVMFFHRILTRTFHLTGYELNATHPQRNYCHSTDGSASKPCYFDKVLFILNLPMARLNIGSQLVQSHRMYSLLPPRTYRVEHV